jgi:hypothetical protein
MNKYEIEPFIFLFLLFIFLFLFRAIRKGLKNRKKTFLKCPIRGVLKKSKYDSKGKYSEEYQRIRLINYVIKNKNIKREQIIIEHRIPIGHGGRNSLVVDLAAIKIKTKEFIFVAEVKKDYNEKRMRSAIEHQLIPAMMLLNSKHGIYFDGTENSLMLTKNKNDIIKKRFIL